MKDIVIFLNGMRGARVIAALHEALHDISAVVTPPSISEAQISNIVGRREIAHLPIENVNDPTAVAELNKFKPSIFVIAGCSSIFKRPLLDIPRLGVINLHAGPLPQYRGGSPLNWQLLSGETEAGISVIRVDEGIDTGPVLSEARFPIGSRDTIADLHERANSLFPAIVIDALTSVEAGHAGRIQDEEAAHYWHQRSDIDGKLDLRRMLTAEVDRIIRAVTKPYPGAWVICEGRRVRIFSAKIPSLVVKGSPGRVCYVGGLGPYLVCADKAILITSYEFEGGVDERLRNGQYVT